MPVIISGSTGISGTDGSAATPAVQGTDANTGMFFPAADTIAFAEGGTEVMRIDASGNVGIGTSSPSARLDVASSGNFADILLKTASVTQGIWADQSGALGVVGTVTNHPLTFYTNNTERARITSGGRLLLGTTTELGKITFAWDSATEGGLSLRATSGSFAGSPIIFYNSSAGVSGFISQSAGSVAYNTSSDYRLKHDVAPLTGGLAAITALKPSTYKWNADNSHGEGFIAHELAEHIPLAVTGEKDATNEDGSIKPQGVDYSKIVVHLVAAVQELTAKLEAAEARIATLEAR